MNESFAPHTEEKNWGFVQHIFANKQASVSCLQVKAGQCCSRHYHKERVNQFCVLEGVLVVELWDVLPSTPHQNIFFESQGRLKVLKPGDVAIVPTWKVHRFRVLKSGRVVEVYYPDKAEDQVQLDDIERLDVGGEDPIKGIWEAIEEGVEW